MIKNFNKVYFIDILTRESTYASNLNSDKIRKFNKAGFHDGTLFNVKRYSKKSDTLSLFCEPHKFFDMLDDNRGLNILNVNALIYASDGKEKYIILIKRDKKVYDFAGAYDLPAGFATYQDSPKTRMYDRIKKDTKIKFDELRILPKITLYKRKNFLGLYYFFNYVGLIKDLKKKAGNKVKVVKLKNIKKFVKNNKCYDFLKYIKQDGTIKQ